MGRPPATWKKVELRIARYLGGNRRGADFSDRDDKHSGKDDVIGIPGWALEIKHSKKASFGTACKALEQVSSSTKDSDNVYCAAIIHKAGVRIIEQSVVCFVPTTFWSLLERRNVFSFSASIPIYSSTKPLWGAIIKAVTMSSQTRIIPVIPCVHVYKLPWLRDSSDHFIACSLPNFKKYILPLAQ